METGLSWSHTRYLFLDGPIDQLRTQYSCDPSLPSADIIHRERYARYTRCCDCGARVNRNSLTGTLCSCLCRRGRPVAVVFNAGKQQFRI